MKKTAVLGLALITAITLAVIAKGPDELDTTGCVTAAHVMCGPQPTP